MTTLIPLRHIPHAAREAEATARRLDAAVDLLTAAGYSARLSHDDTYLIIPDAAPDSSDYGSTEPGSTWDDACGELLADVQATLGDGYSVMWSDDDIHIEVAS